MLQNRGQISRLVRGIRSWPPAQTKSGGATLGILREQHSPMGQRQAFKSGKMGRTAKARPQRLHSYPARGILSSFRCFLNRSEGCHGL
jgi:hypothetical protein